MSVPENGATKVLNDILDVQKFQRWLNVGLFVIVMLFGGVAWVIRSHDITTVDRIADQNTTALCAFRHDVEERITSSEQFLQDHPNGIPGISPAIIRSNITAQQQTVDALAILDCRGG